MSGLGVEVYLRDRASGELVEAELFNSITQKHLADHQNSWRPHISETSDEHGHWDWRQKCNEIEGLLSYQSFALECEKETQGLMVVNTIKRCRIVEQANKHLVYVEYLEAAPWNRRAFPGGPRYQGVGTVLVAAAIQLSIDEGNHGRIGLHSLPQADTFYREKCKMTDLGPDISYHPTSPLRYFEMTMDQAKAFMA